MGRKTLAAVLTILLAVGPACSSTHTLYGPPPKATAPAEPLPPKVRVILDNGEAVVVRNAVVEGDSLRGGRVVMKTMPNKDVFETDQTTPYAVAMAEVREIKVKEHSASKTAILVVSILAILAATVFVGLDNMEGTW